MSWTATRLDRVACVQARIGWKALTADEYVDDGYAFLSTPNIKARDIDFESVNYITECRYDESPELKLQEGDVLLAKDGSTLGICNIVRDLPRAATVNGSIAVIRPHSIDGLFLRYYLETASIRDQIELVKNGMGVPHLFQRDINRLPLMVPPIETQRSIAKFLDDQIARLDEIIRLREEQGSATLERFRSLIDERVDSPAHRPVPLRRVLTAMQTGSTPTIPETDPSGGGAVPWYTPDSFGALGALGNARRWYPRGAARSYGLVRFPAGSVLFVGIGWASGRVAYLSEPGAGNQQLTALLPGRLMRGRFLLWQMFHMGERLRRNAPFTVIPVLSNDYLRSSLVRLPGLDVQDKAIDDLDGEAQRVVILQTEMRAQIDLLLERKRSLITAAVAGEFDVSSASGRGVA